MRLILKLRTYDNAKESKIKKYTIQGMLYSNLIGSKFENLHDLRGFKFFTFSDLFPSGNFVKNDYKNLIISSPNTELINAWYDSFRSKKYLYLSNISFEIISVKKIDLEPKNEFETGSPIVLFENNKENRYFSFEKNKDLQFFLERLKDNALKKFNAFYNEEYYLGDALFDKLIFKKEVAIPNTINAHEKNNKENMSSVIIGSVWSLLSKSYIENNDRKFYKFIMDCGLGEKNSLGFGFINPRKR